MNTDRFDSKNLFFEVEGDSKKAQDLKTTIEYFKWKEQQERKNKNG